MSRYAIEFSVVELLAIQKEAENRARNRALTMGLDWESWYKENAEAIRDDRNASPMWVWSRVYQRCTEALKQIHEDLKATQQGAT